MSSPWAIPTSWQWSTMGQVAAIAGGGTPSTVRSDYFGGDIPWVTPADLSGYTDKYIGSGARNLTASGLKNSGARLLPAGTVLFTSRAPIGYVAIALNPISTNQGFKSFVLRPGLDPDYIYYYLQHARQLATDLASGTTFLELSGKKAGQIPVPVPPMAEQKRIATKLDKLTTQLAAAVRTVERIVQKLSVYRSALLQAAITGDLLKSREMWRQLQVSEVGEIITGRTPPTGNQKNYGGDLPFFKPTDLDAGYNVRVARQYLSKEGATHVRILPPLSVLVTCIGATIGKTGLARVRCATNQQINAVIVDSRVASPEWVFWSFISPRGQQEIRRHASATTLPILNKSKFGRLEMAIPPLSYQQNIVKELERRVSVVDAVDMISHRSIERAHRLRGALLEKAFTGHLVPQDRSDTPVEVQVVADFEEAAIKGQAPTSITRKRVRRPRAELAKQSVVKSPVAALHYPYYETPPLKAFRRLQ